MKKTYILILLPIVIILLGVLIIAIYTMQNKPSTQALQEAPHTQANQEQAKQIIGIKAGNATKTNATVEVTANFPISEANIYYGTNINSLKLSESAADTRDKTTTFLLGTLKSNTQYFFYSEIFDQENNLYKSGIGTFTTE
jgi:hypothetical protein